jgi:putative Mg2+ transporter-C (MgtC) family protein
MRTNALVALASSLFVAAAEYAQTWAHPGSGDPTRVMQGIVAGVGFLGAGVIVKEGFSVRGLTTAAGIWAVAAIGALFGAGLYASGAAATVIAWMALEVLRQIENRVPVHAQVHCQVGFARQNAIAEERLRELVASKGFAITELSYHLDGASEILEYELVMWSGNARAPNDLERTLLDEPSVRSFRISATRD